MPLLLPNLDDRTWADIVGDANSVIPVYGPEWTDQNYSDPGITLVELCAWIAEMDIYQLNQISDREKMQFLRLVGIVPKSPSAARAVLSLYLKGAASPIDLPSGIEFAGSNPAGSITRFRTLSPITAVPGSVAVLQAQLASGFQDLTPQWTRGTRIMPFGEQPQSGAVFYMGLTEPLPVGKQVCLYLTFDDSKSGPEERSRLIEQMRESSLRCKPVPHNPCAQVRTAASSESSEVDIANTPLSHYGVRTVWQYRGEAGGQSQWITLDPSQGQIKDHTRAFTLDGSVAVSMSSPMVKEPLGSTADEYYWIRCIFDAGAYDAAPAIKQIAFNAVDTEQAVFTTSELIIQPAAALTFPQSGPPYPNSKTALKPELDANGNITAIQFGAGEPNDPEFVVLGLDAPASGKPGKLTLQAALLGFGNGLPSQTFSLHGKPIVVSTLHVYTLEDNRWHRWELRRGFASSGRTDHHAVIDATQGTITFGNGEHGRVPGVGSAVFAVVQSTEAQFGNLAKGTIAALADSPRNHALLFDPATSTDRWPSLNAELSSFNSLPARGGAAAETIDHAAGRADQLVMSSGRAVTLADYEKLALATPGTRIARVTAVANLHPDFPCFKAPGMITLIVLPYLPAGSPVPSPGLLRAVASYLKPRRVIGTRIEVVGPTYLDVEVQATVRSMAGTNKSKLQQAIVNALNSFFDPLKGGPEETGWPFGRSVYRAEILKVIGQMSGVDFVSSLAFVADGGQPQCGNVCLGPTWLLRARSHQIAVN